MKSGLRVAICLLALGLAACGNDDEATFSPTIAHTPFNNGVLFSAESWADDLGGIYVLAVETGITHAGSTWGGPPELQELDGRLFQERDEVRGFTATVTERRHARFADHTYDLRDGNLFVVAWRDSGAIESTQVNAFIDPHVGPRLHGTVGAAEDSRRLRMFQERLGPDHPAQAVSPLRQER